MLPAVLPVVLRVLIERLRYLLSRPSWLSEVASGITTMSWGVLASDINSNGYWPSLQLFFEFSLSPVWGYIAIALGIGQMGLFKLIDRDWGTPWVRFGGALAVAWLWGVVTISAARDNPSSIPPGAAASFGWWFVNAYLISRIVMAHRRQ
jgi:hypothetical protein